MNKQNFLIGRWIGYASGTHPSNIFIEFKWQNQNMDAISAEIRAATPNNQKVKIYTGICNQIENQITITLNEIINDHLTNNTGNLIFKIISKNQLEGNFELNTGAKGIIQISKLFTSDTTLREPSQIIAKEHTINYPLTIYKKDIKLIIEKMKELATNSGTVTITEQAKGTKITKYADEYLKTEHHQEKIDSLSLTAQVIASGFFNTLTLNLNRRFSSNIISQSNEYLWSHSAPIVLKEFLEQRANKLLSWYKKYGLEINGILFLALITILPSFNLRLRIVFVIIFMTFIFIHRIGYRWVSQTIIQANTDTPTTFKEKYPKITSIGATIFSALVSAMIGYGVNYGIKHFIPEEKIKNTVAITTTNVTNEILQAEK